MKCSIELNLVSTYPTAFQKREIANSRLKGVIVSSLSPPGSPPLIHLLNISICCRSLRRSGSLLCQIKTRLTGME